MADENLQYHPMKDVCEYIGLGRPRNEYNTFFVLMMNQSAPAGKEQEVSDLALSSILTPGQWDRAIEVCGSSSAADWDENDTLYDEIGIVSTSAFSPVEPIPVKVLSSGGLGGSGTQLTATPTSTEPQVLTMAPVGSVPSEPGVPIDSVTQTGLAERRLDDVTVDIATAPEKDLPTYDLEPEAEPPVEYRRVPRKEAETEEPTEIPRLNLAPKQAKKSMSASIVLGLAIGVAVLGGYYLLRRR